MSLPSLARRHGKPRIRTRFSCFSSAPAYISAWMVRACKHTINRFAVRLQLGDVAGQTVVPAGHLFAWKDMWVRRVASVLTQQKALLLQRSNVKTMDSSFRPNEPTQNSSVGPRLRNGQLRLLNRERPISAGPVTGDAHCAVLRRMPRSEHRKNDRRVGGETRRVRRPCFMTSRSALES